MKLLKHTFFWMSMTLLAACSSSDSNEPQQPPVMSEPQLELKETNVSIEAVGGKTTLELTSSSPCTVTGGLGWVTATPNEGKLTLEVAENLGQKERVATLTVTNAEKLSREFTVKQPAHAFKQDHHYKLPIVFHVLYYKESDPNQYVREGHLGQILNGLNDYYDQCGVDLPIDFVPVTHTPEGELLPEPGVHRIKTNRSTYNPTNFLNGAKKEYLEMMWDPAQYINVFIYKFSNELIAGISQFPILPLPYELAGIGNLKEGSNINANPYPQCVCINNQFIYDMPKSDDDYQMGNPVVTLAHELGHFLGLYHAFNQALNGDTNWNKDSDYCTDTEPYNKYQYDQELQVYLNANGYITSRSSEAYQKYVMREHSFTGEKFRSVNIMDYAVGDANRFTAQQADRIRYILHHSLYRPGPKDYTDANIIDKPVTRSAADDAANFKPHFIE